jgi:hypothetical protein
MPRSDFDETKASARLPHLDVEIVHRRARDGAAEQILVSLQATPSFEAFTQFFDTVNPFRLWANLFQMMWLPWVGALPRVITRGAERR